MPERIAIVSPIDDSIVAERTLAADKDINAALKAAVAAQAAWRHVPVAERAVFCHRAIDEMVARARAIERYPLPDVAGLAKADGVRLSPVDGNTFRTLFVLNRFRTRA